MGDPSRPALPEVLAALTVGEPSDPPLKGWGSWTITTPAEAAELLVTRGVLPEGWHGDTRRGWPGCVAADDGWGDWRDVVLPTPLTTLELVAVASLGWPAIQRAEELAREACHALAQYGCPTPDRVVWRVGSRSPANDVLWRSDTSNRAVVSVRGAVLVGGRLDVRPDRRVVAAAEALWTSGLALDAITDDAVRIVVPPVGGAVRPAEWGPQPSGVYGWGR